MNLEWVVEWARLLTSSKFSFFIFGFLENNVTVMELG
jgi:hypothetical protein